VYCSYRYNITYSVLWKAGEENEIADLRWRQTQTRGVGKGGERRDDMVGMRIRDG